MSAKTTPHRAFDRLVYSIPPSLSDIILRAWGFDLRTEYLQIIRAASLPPGGPVLELATGSGRMASVLARSGHLVLSGDRELGRLPEATTRVGLPQAGRVAYIRLNLECLPFSSGSCDTIVCLNTLHELARPDLGVDELLRVHSGTGPFVVGDFNERGFEIMQQLHRLVYRNDHPRGTIPIGGVQPLLERRYPRIAEVTTPLNTTFIASGRTGSPPEFQANPFG